MLTWTSDHVMDDTAICNTRQKKKWSLFGARIGLEPQRIMNWKSRTDNNQSQECDLSSLFLMIVRCTCVSVVWEREAILLLSFCFYFEPYDDILQQKKEEYKALQENWDLSLPGTPRKSEKCRWWTFNFRGVSFIVLSLQPSLLFEQKTRLKWETQGLALPEIDSLPCACDFAVCKFTGTRQTHSASGS